MLLVDIDPQGNATMGCGVDKYQLKYSICEVLLSECSIKQAILPSDEGTHQLIAANTDLIAAEVNLVKQSQEFILKQVLDSISSEYDFYFN